MDALANSGMMISPMVYGGIGVAIAVIGGFIFLFRRKSRLRLKQEAVQTAYGTGQEQKDFALNMESLSAQDTANDPQESSATAEAEQQPVEDTGEQGGADTAGMFSAAEPSAPGEKAEETPEPADDNAGDKPPEQPKGEDSMLDLFTAEVVDDSNAGKLAASLDNVDMSDIMGEAQSLVRKLKGSR